MPVLPLRAAIVAAILLLSACSSLTPESRLRAGLQDAGLPPLMAGCMAKRMADRLSLMQLRKLQSLATLRKSHSGEMTVDQLLHNVRTLQDPEVFAVASTSAIACVF